MKNRRVVECRLTRVTLSFWVLQVAILIGCTDTSEDKTKNEVKTQPNKIVLILDKSPENKLYTFPNGIYTVNPGYEIKYIDDHGIPRLLDPKTTDSQDTLVIETKRNPLEVQHAFKGLDNLSYLFHNGDSVLFTYNGLKPHCYRAKSRN